MNNDQIEGRWEQLRGRAKKAWAELTDDDFLRAEGSVDKLYGVIQEKVGDSQENVKKRLVALEEAETQWDELKGRARRAWGELTDDDMLKADGSAEKLQAVIHEKIGASKEAIQQKLDDLKTR
jgi:uncharacterized protein YjbJ (UPF0337 family)